MLYGYKCIIIQRYPSRLVRSNLDIYNGADDIFLIPCYLAPTSIVITCVRYSKILRLNPVETPESESESDHGVEVGGSLSWQRAALRIRR